MASARRIRQAYELFNIKHRRSLAHIWQCMMRAINAYRRLAYVVQAKRSRKHAVCRRLAVAYS